MRFHEAGRLMGARGPTGTPGLITNSRKPGDSPIILVKQVREQDVV